MLFARKPFFKSPRRRISQATYLREGFIQQRYEATGLYREAKRYDMQGFNKSISVMFYTHHFSGQALTIGNEAPFSLYRALTKTAFDCVNGDVAARLQDGTHVGADFFQSLDNGDMRGLSTFERMLARSLIVTSNTPVFAKGGYPTQHFLTRIEPPLIVSVVSKAGIQLEAPHLDYSLFMIDCLNETKQPKQLQYYYPEGQKASFNEACQDLGAHDVNSDFARLRLYPWYVCRRLSDGKYYTSLFPRNSAILDKGAYRQALKEDVYLTLMAVNNMALKAGKKAHFKATLAGMGYFASIATTYNVSDILLPILFQVYREVLTEYLFEHIGVIEFPIFDHKKQFIYQQSFGTKSQIEHVVLMQRARDILDFDGLSSDLHPVVLNPADANAFRGNELNFCSVEGALGCNTLMALIQNYYTNPLLLDPKHHQQVTAPWLKHALSQQHTTRLGLR